MTKVVIKITPQELFDARDQGTCANHRELVQQKFVKAGVAVIKWDKLKYDYSRKEHMTVTGKIGEGLVKG
jgi:hypothetical protein